MSFREKTAWISLLSMTGIYGVYFCALAGHAPTLGALHFGGLAETVVALIVVQAAATAVVAALDPRDAGVQRDERERLIELRATRIAYAGLASGVTLACLLAAVDRSLAFGTDALLFILVAAELVRSASQIVPYRRDA